MWARLLVLLTLASCGKSEPSRNLDLDAIRLTGDARLRTDTVGDGEFASTSSFVLVDAENTARDGAYVTLAGELTSDGGVVGQLKPQSLWIPAHEVRTFALVDTERVPRPAATSARILVKGALVPQDGQPPRARITDLHVFDDYGKSVAQAYLVNDAPRLGKVIVIASFHDAHGQPMTRPFQTIEVDGNQKVPVQFVGPPGSTAGTIFVGDVIY
jgi:hypothetical protein